MTKLCWIKENGRVSVQKLHDDYPNKKDVNVVKSVKLKPEEEDLPIYQLVGIYPYEPGS